GFNAQLQQKPTNAPVPNEADNGLKNDRGSIAMARTADPHSASAQFFINVADNGFLNFTAPTRQGWGYAVFGKVTSGMDVVDAIVALPTGAAGPFGSDVPKQAAIIESARVLDAD
ncbi:MAG TPA: cyclophilin, partial [Gammaproteobacteria bacterium]|nr:cyclophilin [Gammaproteobacteria bacterium]MCH77592.1 cyclophilin [Gammaproteobacteria bacterium]